MRSLKLVAVLVPLLLAVGCAKRTAKNTASNDETVGVKVQPQPAAPPTPAIKNDDKGNKAAEPNWLNDPRFKKDHAPALPAEAPPGGKPGWGLTPPPGGVIPPPPVGINPVPAGPGAPGPIAVAPLAPGPVAPPAQPVVGAPRPPGVTAPAFKPVAEADMKEVWVFIENASGASGRMPSQLLTFQALVAAKSPAADLVKDGSIYLTGAAARESIWAFETKALTNGGLAVSQNGVETLTAAELKKRLRK